MTPPHTAASTSARAPSSRRSCFGPAAGTRSESGSASTRFERHPNSAPSGIAARGRADPARRPGRRVLRHRPLRPQPRVDPRSLQVGIEGRYLPHDRVRGRPGPPPPAPDVPADLQALRLPARKRADRLAAHGGEGEHSGQWRLRSRFAGSRRPRRSPTTARSRSARCTATEQRHACGLHRAQARRRRTADPGRALDRALDGPSTTTTFVFPANTTLTDSQANDPLRMARQPDCRFLRFRREPLAGRGRRLPVGFEWTTGRPNRLRVLGSILTVTSGS